MKDRIEQNIFQVRKYDIHHIMNFIRLKGRHFFNGVSLEIIGTVHLIVQGARRWGGEEGNIYLLCFFSQNSVVYLFYMEARKE